MDAPNPLPKHAVAIGASAGAVDALSAILPRLSPDFDSPIFIVVHLRPDSETTLPEIFQRSCPLPIHEAQDKDPILPSHIYLAPPDYHLLVEKNGRLSLSNDEPVLFSRPSIDVLFESAADAFRERLTGVVLTGANEDGAKGLRSIIDKGGRGIVQLPDTAHAPTMPKAAAEACPQAATVQLEAIAECLNKFSKG